MDYSTQFVNVLEQLEDIMKKKGEHFRARAYSKAKEAIFEYKPIKSSQPEDFPVLAKPLSKNLKSLLKQDSWAIEKTKNDPMFIFTDVWNRS